MRTTLLATMLPIVLALPAHGQLSARAHVNIPITRRAPGAFAPRSQGLTIRNYDPYRYGGTFTDFERWVPVTVYLYDGVYYDYPVVAYAQPIVIYRYRNESFLAPRTSQFLAWRQRPAYRAVRPIYRPPAIAQRGGPVYRAPAAGRQYGAVPPVGRTGRAAPPSQRGGRNGSAGQGASRSRPAGH